MRTAQQVVCWRAALALGVIAFLTSCSTPAHQIVTTTPSSREESIRDYGDEAADLWKAYFPLSRSLLQDTSSSETALRPLLSAGEYDRQVASLEAFRTRGLRLDGDTQSTNFTVRQIDRQSQVVSAYVCVKNIGTRILDESGDDVSPEDRPDESTLLVRFTWSTGDLKIEGSELWTGPSVC